VGSGDVSRLIIFFIAVAFSSPHFPLFERPEQATPLGDSNIKVTGMPVVPFSEKIHGLVPLRTLKAKITAVLNYPGTF